MAPRTFWKGYLKLSLVTCPVAMVPAVSDSNKLRFHTLNRKTGRRVMSRYVDAVTGRPVEDDEQVKGYPRGHDEYVVFEDDELQTVGLTSARTIDIESFVPADAIDWIWWDRAHYLTPSDAVGKEAFCVIRDAMQSTATAAIASLVLYGRERAVMLRPLGKGIVLWTLRYGEEVRDASGYFAVDADTSAGRAELNAFSKLVEAHRVSWSSELAQDPVQTRLLEIIETKRKARKPSARKTPKAERHDAPSNVVSIMSALKKSVSAEKKSGRR